jgi:cytochrome c-type biogenesis protein CcmH/NrfF
MLKWILALAVLVCLAGAVVTAIELRDASSQDNSTQSPQEAREARRTAHLEQGHFWHRLTPMLWGASGGFFLLVLAVWLIIGRKRQRTTRLEAVSTLGSRTSER